MPHGIPMQLILLKNCGFKVMFCDQFHTYSQWFAAKFNFAQIFSGWKVMLL